MDQGMTYLPPALLCTFCPKVGVGQRPLSDSQIISNTNFLDALDIMASENVHSFSG